MTENKALALHLADCLDYDEFDVVEDSQRTAAELRRLYQENEEDQGVIAVWRGRTQRAEAERDALLKIFKDELHHAEWRDKIICPTEGEDFQNWKVSIYLPVPIGASDKSPEAALDRVLDQALTAVISADGCVHGAVLRAIRNASTVVESVKGSL